MSYILSIDQSTQGTKAILFDDKGNIVKRVDKAHQQLIDANGYISHDPNEIFDNVVSVVSDVIAQSKIDANTIQAVGISNQRETTVMWDADGHTLANAVVWQCSRASEIAKRYEPYKDDIFDITGLVLSPYFPASKMRWLIEYVQPQAPYYFGTMDTWLIYKLTNQQVYKTDASNASRTQLFDIHTGTWSNYLCNLFEIPKQALPEVCDSNACFGYTDFVGLLEKPIPICAVMGDSHASLYGQGCHAQGQVKTTLGTGSSIMMNIGDSYKKSTNGLTTSLAWKIDGKLEYVFEGNVNYAGAVITWLQKDLQLIDEPDDTIEAIARSNPDDETILVPAFSGLSAPYWKEDVRALFYGMSRTTKRNELIKATVESIAFQISDVLHAMAKDSGLHSLEVKTDGGPSKNPYLMQFLSDMARATVYVSSQEELSAIGVAYMAGIKMEIYHKETIFSKQTYKIYETKMEISLWKQYMDRWNHAIAVLLHT
ncbi:glycerol kinase [Breznakia blatticola]|uniref:ATP:glycerol 3-phosphotransferase n=1 Tax=Breznakia blatticola TaxID=1754012 RepID=A0A4R7Z924_9FIRM|nr:FGGY family carbohydrate kinase [Breznakia blatticola]TDW13236.1 glycerol kinase [Breznakia blatticola]